MPRKSFRQALNEALRSEMARDDSVIVLGEDVCGGTGASGEKDAWGGAFGVTKAAPGIIKAAIALIARSSTNLSPDVATITGSTTRGVCLARVSSVSATCSTKGAEPSMPVLITSAPISVRQARICAVTASVATGHTPCTPVVSWAVIAVIAVIA